MTNKSIRDYINLIENAQKDVVEGQMPKTWHDVDPKLGKAVDKMSQAEKVKKGLAHPDTLNTEKVYKVVALDKSNALKKPTKLNVKASSIEDVFSRLAVNDWYALSINGVEVINGKRLKQGVAEGSDNISSMIQQYEDMVELVYDLPPGRKKNIAIDKRDALEAQIEAMPGGVAALRKWAKSYNDTVDEGVAEATGNPGMPHDFTAVQPGAEVWYKGRFAGWTTGKVYDDPYGKHGKMVAFDPNPSEFPGDEGRVLSLPYDEISLRKSTSIGKLKGPGQGVAEEQVEESSPEAIAKINQITRK